jgi:hypothetical protein
MNIHVNHVHGHAHEHVRMNMLTLPNASSMLASLATKLTRIGVRLEPSRSNRPLVNAAAATCGGGGGEQHTNHGFTPYQCVQGLEKTGQSLKTTIK